MSISDGEDPVRDIIKQLREPITEFSTLLSLLCAPLESLGLLPPQFLHYNTTSLQSGTVQVHRHIPGIQRAIIDHIYPTWEPLLQEKQCLVVLQQYFCPDIFHSALNTSGSIVLQAFSAILSTRLSPQCLVLLESMTINYPIDLLHSTIFHVGGTTKGHVEITWKDCVQNIVAVPAKVANFVGIGIIPSILQQGNYFNHISRRCESLIKTLSLDVARRRVVLTSLTYLVTKLVNLGVFPSHPPELPSQPSFFQTTLPLIRDRGEDTSYTEFWSEIIFELPSSIATQTVLSSFFRSLDGLGFPLGDDSIHRALVKREATLLRVVMGDPALYDKERLDLVFSVFIGREFDETHARIFVAWLSSSGSDKPLEYLLNDLIPKWSSSEQIKHSLLRQHRYLTSLLLLSITCLSKSSTYPLELTVNGQFIGGVGCYINHMDPSVRLCGMLAAEVIASFTEKKLDFEVWEGNDPAKVWFRNLRQLIRGRDVDADVTVRLRERLAESQSPADNEDEESPQSCTIALNKEGYDSDDSLTGYSSLSSSRSPSPSLSELEEREKDPSLNVTIKKVQRPVYLAQLGELLRGSSTFNETNCSHEADRMETALFCGEDLIRRKQFFGTELDENAVNLVHGYLNLTDKFDLDNFLENCQKGLVALVACCPQKCAPSIIEEFFRNQYSIEQRKMMLNALVLGAQELHGARKAVSLPSRALPPGLHAKYVLPSNQNDLIQPLLRDAVDCRDRRDRDLARLPPDIVRERRLRIQKSPVILDNLQPETSTALTFVQVAAEHFLGPLLNRFWIFLRDEQTREERTVHLKGRQQYYSSGTGLILNPITLRYFLNALCVLMHLSRYAPEWSAVLASDALELAISLGSRPVSRLEEEDTVEDNSPSLANKQAAVLTAVLELVLVVLDGAWELDEGKSLSLEHSSLMYGLNEWVTSLFNHLDGGLRAQGSGGSAETNLPRTCASIVVKVDQILSKWRRSMVNV